MWPASGQAANDMLAAACSTPLPADAAAVGSAAAVLFPLSQHQLQDAAANAYSCYCHALHSMLTRVQQPTRQQQPAPGLDLAVLKAAVEHAALAGTGVGHLVQQEVAALQLLGTAAAAYDAAQESAALRRILAVSDEQYQQQQPLLWPSLEDGQHQHGKQPQLEPLAAAALLPSTVVSANALLPACLLQRLPLRQQAMLLEGWRACCSPAAASAAVAKAQQTFDAAAMAAGVNRPNLQQHPGPAATGSFSQQQPLLWRYPVLNWALPAAASALQSSIPAAAPELWHQASLGSHAAAFVCTCTHRLRSTGAACRLHAELLPWLSLCTCGCPVARLPDCRRLWA